MPNWVMPRRHRRGLFLDSLTGQCNPLMYLMTPFDTLYNTLFMIHPHPMTRLLRTKTHIGSCQRRQAAMSFLYNFYSSPSVTQAAGQLGLILTPT